MTEIINERSVRADLLTPGGWVLDVGSRGLVFARDMVRRGCKVVAMDPEPPEGVEPGIHFEQRALVGIGNGGRYRFASWDNGEGDHLVMPGMPEPPQRAAIREVEATDILDVMRRHGVERWDCVKMNCEGAEFGILGSWPGPIARQLTVSFHDHTGANPGGEATYSELFKHLGQWYVPLRHVWEPRYGAGDSYWDSLLCLRELA